MVKFKGRTGSFGAPSIEVVVSADNKVIFIEADLKPISMAVEAFFKSGQIPTVANHEVSARFGFSGDRLTKRTFTITQYTTDEGILSPDKTEENEAAEVKVVCQQDGNGTQITLSGDTAESTIETHPDIATVGKIGEALADYLAINREKASLGYGPQHKLEDIEPTSIIENQIPETGKDAINLFRPWINECLNRSRTTRVEQAFFNDWGNNTVGIVTGDSGSVSFPHTLIGEMNFAAHTHPNIKSVPLASSSDIQLMTAQRTGSIHCVMRGLYNSYFSPAPKDKQGETDLIDRGGVTFNTFDKTMLSTYRVTSGDRVVDIDDYINEYYDLAYEMIVKDSELAIEQVEKHRGELTDAVVDIVINEINQTRERVIDDLGGKTEEAIRGAYRVENKVVVPMYHEFEIEQHDTKPVERIR